MADESLVGWIRTSLSQGYTIDQVRSMALQQGWAPSQVEDAMRMSSAPQGGGVKAGKSRKTLMLIIIIPIVAAVSLIAVIFSFPTVQIGLSGPESLTPDIEDYDELCNDDFMGNTCFNAVAVYNKDTSICDKIIETEMSAVSSSVCKRIIAEGRFMFREYTEIKGCSYSSTAFGNRCKEACQAAGLDFEDGMGRKKLSDPIPLSSVSGYLACEGLSSGNAIISCYCF
jgi:hypothetical protein